MHEHVGTVEGVFLLILVVLFGVHTIVQFVVNMRLIPPWPKWLKSFLERFEPQDLEHVLRSTLRAEVLAPDTEEDELPEPPPPIRLQNRPTVYGRHDHGHHRNPYSSLIQRRNNRNNIEGANYQPVENLAQHLASKPPAIVVLPYCCGRIVDAPLDAYLRRGGSILSFGEFPSGIEGLDWQLDDCLGIETAERDHAVFVTPNVIDRSFLSETVEAHGYFILGREFVSSHGVRTIATDDDDNPVIISWRPTDNSVAVLTTLDPDWHFNAAGPDAFQYGMLLQNLLAFVDSRHSDGRN